MYSTFLLAMRNINDEILASLMTSSTTCAQAKNQIIIQMSNFDYVSKTNTTIDMTKKDVLFINGKPYLCNSTLEFHHT